MSNVDQREVGQMMTIDDEEGFHKWQLSLANGDRTLYEYMRAPVNSCKGKQIDIL